MLTEEINEKSVDIDKKSTLEMLRIINEEDKTVAYAVEKAIPQIEVAIDAVSENMKNGGRLIYVGAGTSGRLAVQDAAECTVTYGVEKGTVTAIIAGGKNAVFTSYENVEDDFEAGANAVKELDVTDKDSIVGISASGTAAFVCGALSEGKRVGCVTIAFLCNESGRITEYADHAINVITGPEVIGGSTRMKAGTAQKLVLNMFSTIAMIKLGRVTGNQMTYMKPSNKKLVKRARSIVAEVCKISYEQADRLLLKYDNDMQKAIEAFEKGE
ncbi:MAG: N-acetylmuramic acid 6-phosphate etherase [Ruminococcaceae bacterium]|nr:N-acetylmuramic acid 6-phosphate etherase [Oscillospiraceae bacterium]